MTFNRHRHKNWIFVTGKMGRTMAIIQQLGSSEPLYLRGIHVVGRNPSKVDTVLNNPDASQIHASFCWTGNGWEITDHSRNGTLLDGRRLPSNIKTPLAVGQTIQFALGASVLWRVINLDPPTPMLLPVTKGLPPIPVSDLHLLPNEQEARASVYLNENGQCVWECETGHKLLQDGDAVEIDHHVWRFSHAPHVAVTLDARAVVAEDGEPRVSFEFSVSQNEEHICLTVRSATEERDLGERTHHYSLLTLARQRVADAGRGIDIFSQGWVGVDDLSRMLGMEPPHLNTQLFRARNQIARDCPPSWALQNVIERRRGEVRFGGFPFRIVRGSIEEASFIPAPHFPTKI